MGGGDSKDEQQQVQTSGPPAWLTTYLKKGVTALDQWFTGSKPEMFPGSTVAERAPETLDAWSGTAARAKAGSPINKASGDYLQSVLRGDYLNAGNPHEAALTQSISDRILPRVQGSMSLAGRSGSPSLGLEFGQQLTDSLAPLLFGNYQQERGRMDSAAAEAPTIANQDYVDLAALHDVGSERTDYGQQQLQDVINKFDFGQNKDYSKIAQFLALLNGNFGQTSTTKVSGGGGGGAAGAIGAGLGGLIAGLL